MITRAVFYIIYEVQIRYRFRTKGYCDGARKIQQLKSEDYLSRIMWYVSEPGLHTIRYYGLYFSKSGNTDVASAAIKGTSLKKILMF